MRENKKEAEGLPNGKAGDLESLTLAAFAGSSPAPSANLAFGRGESGKHEGPGSSWLTTLRVRVPPPAQNSGRLATIWRSSWAIDPWGRCCNSDGFDSPSLRKFTPDLN